MLVAMSGPLTIYQFIPRTKRTKSAKAAQPEGLWNIIGTNEKLPTGSESGYGWYA